MDITEESTDTTEKSADDTTEESTDDTTEKSGEDIIQAADGDEESAEVATKQTSNKKLRLKKEPKRLEVQKKPPRRGSRHYLVETMDI